MTDQLEPIDDATMYRRKIDNSLARFSAAHDEMAAVEEERRERRAQLKAKPALLLEQTMTRLQRVLHTENKPEPSQDDRARPSAEPSPEQLETNKETANNAESSSGAVQRTDEEDAKKPLDRKVLARRIIAATMAGLIFLAAGTAWGAKTWFNSKFTEVAALDEDSKDIQDSAAQQGDQNFLIVGSDTRAGAETEQDVGDTEGVPGARADTTMIAHVPADRSRVIVVSFPRDLEVARPSCARWNDATSEYTDETVPAARQAKLNSVYTLGGPACLTKLVQQLTGMRMSHFVGVDFHGFKDMVNAVGGVNIHLETPINDAVLGKIFPQAGDQVINGDQALNFVRARHVKGDVTSDYGRIKRQQQFIASLLKKTMSKDVLFNAGKLTSFIEAFAKATFGQNIGVDQLLTLAQSMRGMDTGKITFLTVPTTGNANSRGNEVLMKEQTTQLFHALISNTALPEFATKAASQ